MDNNDDVKFHAQFHLLNSTVLAVEFRHADYAETVDMIKEFLTDADSPYFEFGHSDSVQFVRKEGLCAVFVTQGPIPDDR